MEPGNGGGSQTTFAHAEDPIVIGEVCWWEISRALTVRGQAVKLPWRVVECFALLVQSQGAAVSREALEEQIWGKTIIDESSLAKCVATLRKALDPAPHGGSYIETVSRVGYRLTVPVGAGPATEVPAAVTVPRPNRWRIYVLAAAVLAIIVAGGYRWYRDLQTRVRAEALAEEGMKLVRRANAPDGARAVALFQQAIELRPDLALPYAGLAEASARFNKLRFETASAMAQKALDLDPNCGECLAIWGYILMTREYRWDEAGRLLKRSVEDDPKNAHRLVWYSMWLSLQGRFPEALTTAKAAVEAKPTFPNAYVARAMAYFLAGRYQEVIVDCERALAVNPKFQPAFYWMGRTHMMLGNDVNVVLNRSFDAAAWGYFGNDSQQAYAGHYQGVLAQEGRRGLAHAWIQEVNAGSPRDLYRYDRAMLFAWIGEYDAALDELEAALVTRPYWVILMPVDPIFAPLHGTPRFEAALRRLERPAHEGGSEQSRR
ncbi:MAG: winged helix-turn-helix domain-containing protein [Acidobacteriota bacterium]